MHKYTLNELCDLGWSHGFVFGKYTKQIMLDDDLLAALDNSQKNIDCYMNAFVSGYRAGSADTVRSDDPISDL